ncbi:MAG: D-galactose 1-dehydrogenase [uncultured Microvirga sp.]|uniref:D-galactose 1-dehydrogenase n=1 Tax=uncultured Microvirga sp. TaxID=412392 RepID=A0A6J4KL65_9HYPH|nr:MAG: D-galactose 1-dehydrogenase [uncultured Microvirga sp.]
MRCYKIGIVGLGKIAEDQHVPVIRADPAFELVAVSSQRGNSLAGVPHAFTNLADMLAGVPELDAVAVCTPPGPRHAIARQALLAGKHVLLEKPPAASLSEFEDLVRTAERTKTVLFATWHAQFNAAVDRARAVLAGQTVKRLRITWKEDVRHWHPGQTWIWAAGGFGVFDPGINALSIVTKILPEPVFIRDAELQFPENRDAPIAAALTFSTGREGPDLRGVFDWRQTGPQSWDIAVETEGGTALTLSEGGRRLAIDGSVEVDEPSAEYAGIYAHFAALLDQKRSDVQDAPLRLVADAFLIGRRVTVAPFED